MNNGILLLILVGLGLNACQPQSAATLATDQVNGLVGNAGYVAATGHAPTVATNDDERVQAHLAYAERELRGHAPASLDPALVRRREHLLDLLHAYWTAGVFPRNYDHPEGRRPCFIDRDGRLCAVGFLVAETAGRPVAEQINQAHQYDRIADMRTPALAAWVRGSGLTWNECALIQPTYGFPVAGPAQATPIPVGTGYAVSSAAWGALNVMVGAVNVSQFNLPPGELPPGERGMACAGLVSGAGQLLFGALHLPADEPAQNGGGWGGAGSVPGKSYVAERTVSYLNIGAGGATLALSAWNLLHRRRPGNLRTAVGVVQYPGRAGGAGLSLTRKF